MATVELPGVLDYAHQRVNQKYLADRDKTIQFFSDYEQNNLWGIRMFGHSPYAFVWFVETANSILLEATTCGGTRACFQIFSLNTICPFLAMVKIDELRVP